MRHLHLPLPSRRASGAASLAGRRVPRRARGQSMMELLVVFPVLVMLVFGIIQFSLIYRARATLNHAAFEAARAGALHNGDSGAMRTALAVGLAPLYAGDPSASGVATAIANATAEVKALGAAKVTVLNPTSAALSDFGRSRLDGQPGRELPSDTLNYRDVTLGGQSRLSVQDANILDIRVSYCYQLIVPLVDRVIVAVSNAMSVDSSLGENGMSDPFGLYGSTSVQTDMCANPLLPGRRLLITSSAMVRMQTPFFESNL